eukprot:TRINITY_DN1661_c0_g1_i1.p1 TRINITY_DN1661_c0_g1~~TRINITY_DN1661_c0_g1_i1.p1  ORF type:complete len:159 (+),score=26.44 TRINITY_DN1661_c0_g1_i1:168-644(+)
MVEQRLSREEMDSLLNKANTISRRAFCSIFLYFALGALVLVIGVYKFLSLLEETSDSNAPFVFGVYFICLLVFGLVFICALIKLKQRRKDLLQKHVDEENVGRLHMRGLHLIIGPQCRYLTLYTKYVPPATHPFDNVTYGFTPIPMNQPFEVPQPIYY